MTSVETARQFLLAGAKDLPEPESLMGVSAAADLIVHALRNGKAILVHGDYDTDGICATALLAGTLARFGGRIFYFAPNRHRHGYGVADEAIHAAKRQGVSVIITVDCGITARRQIAEAKDAGITTIVLDHHEPPETLPLPLPRFVCDGTGVQGGASCRRAIETPRDADGLAD
jgi:single-stranded-DNA-specific exonuclease